MVAREEREEGDNTGVGIKRHKLLGIKQATRTYCTTWGI